jgi:hypothetical protein
MRTDRRTDTDRRADRHDEASSRFSQFGEKRLKTMGNLDWYETNYVFSRCYLQTQTSKLRIIRSDLRALGGKETDEIKVPSLSFHCCILHKQHIKIPLNCRCKFYKLISQ